MMSRSKLIISLTAILAVIASCKIDKTDFGDDEDGDSSPGGIVSIAYLKSMYVNRPVTINREIAVKGTVISSDRFGNFYKTLYLEDASGGIAVRVDILDYYRTFRIGSTVTLYCNNLTLGSYGGALQLGVAPENGSNNVGYIPEEYLFSFASVSAGEEEPPVKEVAISALTPAHIHRSVRISGVQFEDYEDLWCDEGVDTNRTLIDREGNRLDVRTSRYAEFASNLLPKGSGSIRGLLGYFNGAYQLTVINEQYAVMEDERF